MNKALNVLPIIIMAESYLASIVLAVGGRWGSALYWFAAGLLNMAVIFFIKKWG